jgi:TetR/AcrR family transcriptional regulator, tetracycline repressor protein
VADKTALVDVLLDDLLGELDAPPPDADPGEGLHAVMLAAHDLLVRHADLVPLYLARQGARGPHARALGEAMTVLLARLGLTGPAASRVVRALIVHTLGFTALATADDPTVPRSALRADLEVTLDWLLVGAVDSAPG